MIEYTLVGCGRIAQHHLAAALSDPCLHLRAVCDQDPAKAGALVEKFGLFGRGVEVYTDYRRMLEEARPHLVAVATDSGSHEAIALDCLGAGCHVIVEKPMALSLAGADRLIGAARQGGLVLAVCHQNRFNPAIRCLREALEAGRFGKVLYGTAAVRWRRDRSYYQAAGWRGTWERDGGALMNQCIHAADLLCWMLGQPRQVMAVTDRLDHPYIEAEDFGAAVIRFEGGRYGILEGTTVVYPTNLEETLCLFGTCGTAKLGGTAVNRVEEWLFADGGEGEAHRVKAAGGQDVCTIYGSGHRPLYRNVSAAVAAGGSPLITGEEGRRALELVLAVYQSAALGQPVALPLERGATTDYKGRF